MENVKEKVISFVQNYFLKKQEAPSLRNICDKVKVNRRVLYATFPEGMAQICEEADIPVPKERIEKTQRATEGHNFQKLGEVTDQNVMAAVKGRVRGEGYLDELKNMIRKQIGVSREFAEACTNAGVTVVLAALRGSDVADEELKKISKEEGSLTKVVNKATQTALRALRYCDTKKIEQLEMERDEARVECTLAEMKIKEFVKKMQPQMMLERLIHTYLLSGNLLSRNVDGDALALMINKWLTLERAEAFQVPWSVVQANFKKELLEQVERSKILKKEEKSDRK